MTFDEWYGANERRFHTGHMNVREVAAAAWYEARDYERRACAGIAETLYDAEEDIPFDIPADDMGREIATAIRKRQSD